MCSSRAPKCAQVFGVLTAMLLLLVVAPTAGGIEQRLTPEPASAVSMADDDVTLLTQDDFRFGSFIVDRPGHYRLAEDISFNPNSARTLSAAIREGKLPAGVVAELGLPTPVDAYHASRPLPTQLFHGRDASLDAAFSPGGPADPRYDPAAFGVGFFAAIVVSANDVDIDLAGHTIEQHPEHALLQRFFSVVELADQPFVPTQGPADFGGGIEAAERVRIHNGTIGRSAHHGIHGNLNRDIVIENVDFFDYEVAAVALNGVDGLVMRNVAATNRKDVPVLGTFSAARFIAPYIDDLAQSDSTTSLAVGGEQLGVAQVRADLRRLINQTHRDLIDRPHRGASGRLMIDPKRHPDAYALFHNRSGLVDGNSYSFLINRAGVAVDGFPMLVAGQPAVENSARDVVFENVHVRNQRASVNEVVGVSVGDTVAIDPVGAVFQLFNTHPDTGRPLTLTHASDTRARYRGNAVANAQALLAKSLREGHRGLGRLDVSRLNLPDDLLAFVEGRPGFETFAATRLGVVCNGDSMFHVNKGVIGFKIDGVAGAHLVDTSVDGLVNLGRPGSDRCGDYRYGLSHAKATLPGYGGAEVRAYTFAGSSGVEVERASVRDLHSASGSITGFGLLTGAADVTLRGIDVDLATSSYGDAAVVQNGGANRRPMRAIVRRGPWPAISARG